MGSLIEELQRREAAARQEVDELRGEITRLTERLARAEERLSRLEISRETVAGILGDVGPVHPTAGAADPAPVGSRLAGGSPIGVVTVPPWRPGLAQSVLPSSYRDLLEVLADAGRPLRAGGIAAAAGLSTDKSKIEGLVRSAACDIDAFYAMRVPVPCTSEVLLVLSADGKGIVMRPPPRRIRPPRLTERATAEELHPTQKVPPAAGYDPHRHPDLFNVSFTAGAVSGGKAFLWARWIHHAGTSRVTVDEDVWVVGPDSAPLRVRHRVGAHRTPAKCRLSRSGR